ncbi:MAG: hypothetical protein PHY47_00645 [Lachnospiraceae bacterium]|nr:hypothetical protein [Lachnospiraceae bacterium]
MIKHLYRKSIMKSNSSVEDYWDRAHAAMNKYKLKNPKRGIDPVIDDQISRMNGAIMGRNKEQHRQILDEIVNRKEPTLDELISRVDGSLGK